MVGVWDMRKYCLNCGKKFYAKRWTGYPQTEWADGEPQEVPPEHKHFHSLSCMKEWLAKNSEAFHLLLISMGNNDRNNETINRKE